MAADSVYNTLSRKLENNTQYKTVLDYLDKLREIKSCKRQRGDQAVRWLAWARSRQHLKVQTFPVPDGILPDNLTGKLHDVRVQTKWGPDDAVYDANEDFRKKVARGNCFLELSPAAVATPMLAVDDEPAVQCVTYALKKFTGGLGDDDDRKQDDHMWKEYFTQPLEEATAIIATKKANGEAAHLSACNIRGCYLICTGSKNVHMLIRDRGDIACYTDDRFRIARIVAASILDVLESMTAEDRLCLLQFLSLTSYTGIFEILNPEHQHVEDLSYLKRPEVRFITWTTGDLEANHDVQLSSWPPHVSIEVARAFGLATIDYDAIQLEQLNERMVMVRRGYGYEGEVFYFLNASGAVIGLLKKKTVWYILCRAIREKVRNACQQNIKTRSTFSISVSSQKLEKRVDEIQRWLGLDEKTTCRWKALGNDFLRWAVHRIESGKLGFTDVADLFPVTWKIFLQNTGQTDKLIPNCSESDCDS